MRTINSPSRLNRTRRTTFIMRYSNDCEREMFVLIRWMDRELGVPWVQIEGVDVDDDTEEAIADWHYWKERGYEFG